MTPALLTFLALFVLVSGLGFVAARWRRPKTTLAHLDEWGLGGRSFGTWITWFLLGGDFYTAYTMIAVPALVFATGAYGFFALPYAIIIYPIVFTVMPRLWQAAAQTGSVTAADVVYHRTGSRSLEAAVALVGVIATMPYIALQLVGMQVVIAALGLHGELPLFAAFLVLALYTYSFGLRAPALIAFVKDTLVYIVVLAAVAIVPLHLGGYGKIFQSAQAAGAHLLLTPTQTLPYATLALGSALAAFLYPHTLTGIFAAKDSDTIRKNAILLPAYTLLLALIALLGFMAIAAHVHPVSSTAVVPALFVAIFPSWFAGVAFAAIAIGALVPAAVMSIGSANLFTRNFWKAYVHPAATHAEEAKIAKLASLLVKLGALLFVLFAPTQYAIDLQLLGGVWILQTFPPLIFGLYTSWFRAPSLLVGLLAGLITGTTLTFADNLKPVHILTIAGTHLGIYSGLLALAINIAIAALTNIVPGRILK